MNRRHFIKTVGATGVILASHDLVQDLLAQTPPGNPLQSRFKGLADQVLAQAKTAGCTYADIRFTRSAGMNVSRSGNNGRGGGGGFGGRGGGRGGGGGRGRGGGGALFGGPQGFDAFGIGAGPQGPAGFGVRVIHSGVWGFASSPIVTEDEIKRVTGIAIEVAKASAVAKTFDVRLAPVPAYTAHWKSPMRKDPTTVPVTDMEEYVQRVVDLAMKVPNVVSVNASVNMGYDWRYFASSEGSYIEQEIYDCQPQFNVTARVGDQTRSRQFTAVPKTAGWETAEESGMIENAERIANEAVEYCTAKPVGMGVKDLVLSPSHAMLTIHEIIGHPTELDRVMGYEANYAGTSFIKVGDVGKLKYGSPLFNVTADRNMPGAMGTVGYDDDGVKTQSWPLVREGILVGLQTNRETAHYMGETESRGCTGALSWRDYPFLRMPNVHVDFDPKGPSLEEIIADTKDGVMIDGRGSYSIDQQRYNGQFGGNAFWEIKNGKVTRMVTNVTYQAITTDFWANLDAVGNESTWQMFGTGGDAKGQPTQTNSISHGSPWMRISKILVGAAFS
jgi:TldD protein